MNLTFEVTEQSQAFLARGLLKTALYLSVGGVIGILIGGRAHSHVSLWSIIPYLLPLLLLLYSIDLVPSLVLHSQYLKINKDIKLTVDTTSKSILLTGPNHVHTLQLHDIVSVRLAMTFCRFHNDHCWGTWNTYQYAEVLMRTGERYFLTNLLIPDLRSFFRQLEIDFVRARSFFPLVKSEDIPPEYLRGRT